MTDEQILYRAMLFRTGYKTDFCLFNPLDYGFSDEELSYKSIILHDTNFWRKIRSFTWSCNVRFYCVVNSDSIILGSTYSDIALLCNKTWKLFDKMTEFNKLLKNK